MANVPYLTRHSTPAGPRWAIDGRFLAADFELGSLLAVPSAAMPAALDAARSSEPATGEVLAPIDPHQEVWASGVTYLSSRLAREAESQVADVYQRVYQAERPELFFKASGWRVAGPEGAIRIRRDSAWNVPEPELTLVINGRGEIVGHTVGNDVSSRSIEGENPLYLPQAKVYNGSCALGPGIVLRGAEELADVPIQLEVRREGELVFGGETGSAQMKRGLAELAEYLTRELDFPQGVFLMTGTGIVPGEDFSLRPGDRVRIEIAGLVLENPVSE